MGCNGYAKFHHPQIFSLFVVEASRGEERVVLMAEGVSVKKD
jgi:hypothetical protein